VIDAAADRLFDRTDWWDLECREFASLRSVSAFRLDLLRRWLPGEWGNRTVVDLGCGGGFLAVPLARAGARVLGVDTARRALLAGMGRERTFLPVAGDLLTAPFADGSADVVLLADVLEHVVEPRLAIREAARLLRPGGHLFVNTIHRTWRSRVLAITLGEGLGFIPRGTHRWSMFVTPDELDVMTADSGLQRRARTGEAPVLWRTAISRTVVLRESPSLAVGYAALFQRISA